MTNEREAEIRKESTERADDCGRYARELLAALDAARAERDELRGRVVELRLALTQSAENAKLDGEGKTGFAAMPYTTATMLLGHIDELGRELGLWEE